jgi:EAL domain-containing protein (putative c-di-GMP-specific phosphodiesterase class I)
LRWTSKTLGEVSPVQFIPVAEETGLIRDLGRWVLDAAAKQLRIWSAPEEICPEIAVNVTSRQIREARFIDDIKRIIDVNQLKEGQLNLELTEGSLVEDIEGAIKIMHSLRKMGVTFAIDDFGTGFSSLSYLRRMPIQTLKIDRSFIKNVTDNAEDMKLVRSIISMGHDLGLKVVAEGVETERQLAFLQSVQCDQIQGFLFSAPLSSADFRQQRPSWDGSRQGAAGLG